MLQLKIRSCKGFLTAPNIWSLLFGMGMLIAVGADAQVFRDTLKSGQANNLDLSLVVGVPLFVKTITFEMWSGGGAASNIWLGASHGGGGGGYIKFRYPVCVRDTFLLKSTDGGDPNDIDRLDGGHAEITKITGPLFNIRKHGGSGAQTLEPGMGSTTRELTFGVGALLPTLVNVRFGSDGAYATESVNGDPILTTGGLMDPGARGGGGGGAGGPEGNGENGMGTMGGLGGTSGSHGNGGNGGNMDGSSGQDGFSFGGGGGGRAYSVGDLAVSGRGGGGAFAWSYTSPCHGNEIILLRKIGKELPNSVVSIYLDSTTEPSILTNNLTPGSSECDFTTQVNLVEIMRILSGLNEESFVFEGEFSGYGVTGLCLDPFVEELLVEGVEGVTIEYRYNHCGMHEEEFSCQFDLLFRDFRIDDPCSCDDPQNMVADDGSVELFHDMISISDFISGSTITVLQVLTGSSEVYINPDQDPVAPGTILVEEPFGSGNFTLDVWRLPGTAFSMQFEINLPGVEEPIVTDEAFPLCLEATACIVRPIPTLSQWGIIIFLLVLLISGMVSLSHKMRKEIKATCLQ